MAALLQGIELVVNKQRSRPFVILPRWKTFVASFVPMWFNRIVLWSVEQ